MRLTTALLGLACICGVCRFSAQSEVTELKCIVGDVVSFPAAVKKNGLLFRNGSLVARVIRYVPYVTRPGRLQWDSVSGLFSVSALELDDSGEYTVQNMDRHEVLVSVYQLSVYNPVGRPQVSSRNRMKPRCSVLCSVENGRELTLSWHREGQTLSHISSPNLSTPLYLLLEIEENSAPYSCVAENPVSNQTVTVRPEEHCFDPVSRPQVSSRNRMKPHCSVLCSVENGRELTLSWHREGQTLSHTSSPNLSTPLSLPLEIEENSAPYSCVAENPVSNQTVTVRPEEHCFDPVSRPQVSSRNRMKPHCSVLCSVENGRELTLSWHREGQTLSHTSSPNLSTLSLLLEIEENSAPYSCVAENPVSNQTVTIRPEEHCFDPVGRPQVSSRNRMKPHCSVLCSVENGRELTLSWHREGQTLSHTSSPNLSTPLSLLLEIEENSAPYSCVAENPVSNQTVTVRPEEHCFDPVSRPQVSSRNRMKPHCSVLCSVENGRELTLSWHREGQTLSHTSSPNLSTPLSLPLEIEENSAPYSCVAENPVSNQTVTVRPEEHCFDPVARPRVSSRNRMKPRCSVLCSVENGRELTLSWHREGQTLSHTSSPNLSTLSLLLEIGQNSAPYSCVTTNPVSNETVTVRPEEHCFDRDTRSLLVAAIEAFIGILFIVLMGTYICFMIRSSTL